MGSTQTACLLRGRPAGCYSGIFVGSMSSELRDGSLSISPQSCVYMDTCRGRSRRERHQETVHCSWTTAYQPSGRIENTRHTTSLFRNCIRRESCQPAMHKHMPSPAQSGTGD